jgi:hypothetical protein
MEMRDRSFCRVELTIRNNVSASRSSEKNRFIKTEVCNYAGIETMKSRGRLKDCFFERMPIMSRVKLSPSRVGTIRPFPSACAPASQAPVMGSSSGRPEALTCRDKLACTETQRLVFEPVGSSIPLLRQIKTPREAAFLSRGGGSLPRTRLWPNSLLTGKNTGNFTRFGGSNRAPLRRNPYPERLSGHLPRLQARCGTGN